MTGLKIGGVPEHFNLPWRLALEEGKFKEIGLDLFWSDMYGGTGQMIRGFQNNSIDIAVILTEGVTKAILEEVDLKIIGVYVTSPLQWGIHVPFSSDITTPNDLNGKTFAISRKGSGSELMTHVLAEKESWDASQLKFNIVGDIYGGLWALENNEAQGFLWEKYTTHPFCEQKKCRYIGTIETPWPSFVVAVKTSVYEQYHALLDEMFKITNERALQLKKDENAVNLISWRYNLDKDQTKNWLSETDWNYHSEDYLEEFHKTVNYLLSLQLIDATQAKNWKEKLFLKKPIEL